MRLSRKHRIYLVLPAVALAIALLVPSLLVGLFKYIPALAINRAVAAFVVKHDHLSVLEWLLGALIWNAFIGWRTCRHQLVPAAGRSRLQRWRYHHLSLFEVRLVCRFHRPLDWLDAHKKTRVFLLTLMALLTLIAPMGSIVGSIMARYWKTSTWIKVLAISVAYTISCLLVQSLLGQMVSRPEAWQHYVMIAVYPVAAFVVTKKWHRGWASRLAMRITYRPTLARPTWAR